MTYARPPKTAGDVVPFKPRPGVPVLLIGGRKYVLSTDGGPLGDREEDEALQDIYGDRIILPPAGANKWRYLWAYDTDRQLVTMWRVSDGDEKLQDSARSQQSRLITLDKRGQLNRVTNEEFRKIEKEMGRRSDDTLEAMKATLEAAKSEADRELDRLVRAYFEEKVLPKLLRGLREVREGVTPLGFRPHTPTTREDALLRMKSSYVMSEVFRREMSLDDVEAWVRAKGFNLDLVDPQDLGWAIDDVRDDAVKYLPERPETW